MIKVVYLSGFSDMVGGGEHSLLDLMRSLGGSVEPLLVTPQPGALSRKAGAAGIKSVHLPLPPIGIRSMPALLQWLRWLGRERPHLLHANNPRTAFYAGIAGRLLGIPVIFHCRVAARDKKLDPILVRLVSKVICNSDATARRFDAWPGLKPEVIYNGLDVEVAAAEAVGEGRNLLFVGRLSDEKQPDVAIEVFAALAGMFPDLRLLVVGGDDPADPRLAETLRRDAGQAPYGDRILWAGAQESVSAWYAKADAVIVPSKYEGFGRVLVEAMAHGVPVVAFRVGAIPEVIEDGVQGILVEPYKIDAMSDAVASLLNDEVLRRHMGEAGRLRAEAFSLVAHAGAVEELYQAVTGGDHDC